MKLLSEFIVATVAGLVFGSVAAVLLYAAAIIGAGMFPNVCH